MSGRRWRSGCPSRRLLPAIWQASQFRRGQCGQSKHQGRQSCLLAHAAPAGLFPCNDHARRHRNLREARGSRADAHSFGMLLPLSAHRQANRHKVLPSGLPQSRRPPPEDPGHRGGCRGPPPDGSASSGSVSTALHVTPLQDAPLSAVESRRRRQPRRRWRLPAPASE